MEFLKIYQVYYKEEQKKLLDFDGYYNKDCSVFFENSVIAELVPKIEAEYIGVLSWNLRKKINSPLGPVSKIPVYKNTIDASALALDAHIIGLIKYAPHDPVNYFNHIHPKLNEHFSNVVGLLGHEWAPTVFRDVFYSNHFVARKSVYKRYIKEMLNPAMEVMGKMPELMENSGYPKPLPIDLRMKWGINFYPYHSFICERLFSYWVHLNKKNLTISYY